MVDYFDHLFWDGCERGCEFQCTVQERSSDARIEFFDVELDESAVIFAADSSEPIDNFGGIPPLVEIGSCSDLAIYAL